MAKILLTRHGQTAWNVQPPRYRGRADVPLSQHGAQQAQEVAQAIAARGRPSALYTSPLARCTATAAAIAAATGVAAAVVDGLIDIDYGQWQGLTEDEARTRWPLESESWLRAPQYARPPGGESLQDVLARVAAALRELLRRHADQTLVIVAHDAVNRVILLHALDMPLSRYRSFAQDNCALSEIDFADGAFSILRVNDTGHLEAASRGALRGLGQ